MNLMPGILVKQEIEAELKKGGLITDASGAPLPADRQIARPCSYDLTVGTIFWDGEIKRKTDDSVRVPPGGVIALFTAEELNLPDDICATAFAINAMSSKGFLVVNPGHVDPGFKGPLSVKALNIRKVELVVEHGDPVFTVIFQRLPVATTRYKTMPVRIDREREFHKTVVATAPRTFFEMMGANRDGPYPGRDEINSMIRAHWMSRLSTLGAVLTLIFAALAAYLAFPRSPSVVGPSTTAARPSESNPPLDKGYSAVDDRRPAQSGTASKPRYAK